MAPADVAADICSARAPGDDRRPGRRHGALPGHRRARRRRRWPRRRTPISASPSRSRPGSGWRPGRLMGRGARADRWRAGAIMVQHLPAEGGASPMRLTPAMRRPGTRKRLRRTTLGQGAAACSTPSRIMSCSTRCWRRSCCSTGSIHEDGVTVYPPLALERRCGCTRERVADMLRSFSGGRSPAHGEGRPDRSNLRVLFGAL